MRCNAVRFLPENFVENKAAHLNHSADCEAEISVAPAVLHS
jgi:hypothetical protein